MSALATDHPANTGLRSGCRSPRRLPRISAADGEQVQFFESMCRFNLQMKEPKPQRLTVPPAQSRGFTLKVIYSFFKQKQPQAFANQWPTAIDFDKYQTFPLVKSPAN